MLVDDINHVMKYFYCMSSFLDAFKFTYFNIQLIYKNCYTTYRWGYPFELREYVKYMAQGPVSQKVTINHTIDINRNSMTNRVLRKLAIDRNVYETGPRCNSFPFDDTSFFIVSTSKDAVTDICEASSVLPLCDTHDSCSKRFQTRLEPDRCAEQINTENRISENMSRNTYLEIRLSLPVSQFPARLPFSGFWKFCVIYHIGNTSQPWRLHTCILSPVYLVSVLRGRCWHGTSPWVE